LGMGAIGGYTVEQRKNVETREYFGPGVWKGEIDGSPFIININSKQGCSFITSIIIRNIMCLSDLTKFLNSWCKEQSINNTMDSDIIPIGVTSKNWHMNLFNNKLVRFKSGCGVFVNENLPQLIPEINDATIFLETSGSSVKIKYYKDNYQDRPVTIISYWLKQRDYRPTSISDSEVPSCFDSNFLKSILLEKPISLTQLRALVNFKDTPKSKIQANRLLDWMGTHFTSYCRTMGFRKSICLPPTVAIPKEELDILKNIGMDDMLTFFDNAFAFDDVVVEDDNPEMFDLGDELFDIGLDLTEVKSESVKKQRVYNIIYKAIAELSEEMGHNNFQKVVSEQVLIKPLESYKNIISKLLMISEDEIIIESPIEDVEEDFI